MRGYCLRSFGYGGADFLNTQNIAIRSDANFAGGDYYAGPAPTAGLALARRIAHTTYRSPAELEHRFTVRRTAAKTLWAVRWVSRVRYAIESYLDHHGAKLVERFDANSYLAVNEALISHDVARTAAPWRRRWHTPIVSGPLRR